MNTQQRYKATMYNNDDLLPMVTWHDDETSARAEALRYVVHEYEHHNEGEFVQGGYGVLADDVTDVAGDVIGEEYAIVDQREGKHTPVGIGARFELDDGMPF